MRVLVDEREQKTAKMADSNKKLVGCEGLEPPTFSV